MKSSPCGLLLAATIAFFSLACSGPGPLRVGAKNTTEQQILGEIVAQHLEAKMGRTVERQFGLANSQIAHESLISGQADVLIEDPVSAITEVLRQELAADPEANLNICRSQYSQAFQAEWLDPLGYSRRTAVAMRRTSADEMKVTALGGLSALKDRSFKMAAVREFNTRADGFRALQATYDIHLSDGPRFGGSAKELFQMLDQKQVDFVATDSTTGFLSQPQYLTLDDDRFAFPPSAPNIVTRKDALERTPGLREALKPLGGKIDHDAIRQMCSEVEAKGRPAADVAREFLQRKKL